MGLRVYEVQVVIFIDAARVDHADQAAGDRKGAHLAAGDPPERRSTFPQPFSESELNRIDRIFGGTFRFCRRLSASPLPVGVAVVL